MTPRFVPMKPRAPRSTNQPRPRFPGLTRRMVKSHAASLYRDVFPEQPLTEHEWRMVEEDLVRKLERNGL